MIIMKIKSIKVDNVDNSSRAITIKTSEKILKLLIGALLPLKLIKLKA